MSSLTRSPSLEAMYRRRPSFTRPPIRAINSPRLTEEEADQLTIKRTTRISHQHGRYRILTIIFCIFLFPTMSHVIFRRPASFIRLSSDCTIRLRSCSSIRDAMCLTFSEFFNAFFWILHAPVNLTISALSNFRTALKPSYYARLEENGKKDDNRALLSRLDNIKRLEAEARCFISEIQARKVGRECFEPLDNHDGGQLSPEEGSYRYNLRRRVVSADTDSEDDIPRRKRKVGLGTSKRLLHFDEKFQHLETYRIATWLGSIASSFVYYVLFMVHLLFVSVKNSYDGVNRVYHYFAPLAQSSTPHASPYIRSEAGHHVDRSSKDEYPTRRTVSS